jgi:hypothetical protein
LSDVAGTEEDYDTRFGMPDIDDPATTEAGVIMMGLTADRLLAGLGFAALAEDPATVALVVDQARHGALSAIPVDLLIDAGADRWRRARPAMSAACPNETHGGAVRRLWARTYAAARDAVGELGPGLLAYLVACWMRRVEVDRWVEEHRGVSQVAP